MEINYCIMDPTGNITILVETPVPAALQPEIACRLMELEPTAEQVGFLSHDETCDIALRMAGGEFCGNASMCTAVYEVLFSRTDTDSAAVPVTLRVSGASGPIRAEVSQDEDGSMTGKVEMPSPTEIRMIHFPDEGEYPTVFFEGIAHVILEKNISRPEAERCARSWCRHLGTDAIGLMFLERNKKQLTPLVYVPAADTLCWENSCASGSTAVGAYLAAERGFADSVNSDMQNNGLILNLIQPGGCLTVHVSEDGVLRLSGSVRFLGRRSVVTA